MQTAILADIKQGKTDPAILQDLADRFGVRVLAAPPASGFDITAWVLPGFGLILGLALVIALVRRWRTRGQGGTILAPPAPVDPKIAAAVEDEMSKIDSMRR